MNNLLLVNKDERDEFKFIENLKKITNKYVFDSGENKIFISSDYNKKYTPDSSIVTNKDLLNIVNYCSIFTLNKNKWETNNLQTWKSKINLQHIFNFRYIINKKDNIVARDIEKFDKILGFLSNKGKNNIIVFKFKSLEKGKKDRGIECISKGLHKKPRNEIINRLLYEISKNDDEYQKVKYTIKKMIELKINKKENSQKQVKKEKILINDNTISNSNGNEIKMTESLLCVEMELLLRYLDDTTDKRWFFSTLEDVLNKTSKLKNI